MHWLYFLLFGVTAAKAQMAPAAPTTAQVPRVDISVRLDKATFEANEPVDVTVTLTNPNEKAVGLGDSVGELMTYRFALTNAEGQEVKLSVFGQRLQKWPESISNTGIGLPPRQKRYVVFPLRRMFDLGAGGAFTLTVSRGIPLEPVEIAPKQFRTEWSTITSAPLHFTVAPAEVSRDRTFDKTLLTSTRLESSTYLSEQPVWVDVAAEGGSMPRLEVVSLGSQWPQWTSTSPIPYVPEGALLLARTTAPQRPVRLDLARVFDLSLPGTYLLKVIPRKGVPREIRFQVVGILPRPTTGFPLHVTPEERLKKRVGLLNPQALDADDKVILNPEFF